MDNKKDISGDQKSLSKSFHCADCNKEVTPDNEDLVEFLCELMVAKESCIVNDEVDVTVKSHQSLKLNLVATSEVLQTCCGKHENIEQFSKAILTASVNISYNNVELNVFTKERYTEPTE